jgi:cyclase
MITATSAGLLIVALVTASPVGAQVPNLSGVSIVTTEIDDSIVIFTNSNVVHVGDLFNSGRTSFPYVDISAGGNALQMLAAIDRILPLIPADASVIAGHGPLSDRKDLADVREMLNYTIDFVRTRRARGLSLDAIKAEGFPAQHDEWNHGYSSASDWIELIYRSLD